MKDIHDIRRILERAQSSLLRYDGAYSILGDLPIDVENEIFEEAEALLNHLEERINELKAAEKAEFAKGAER